MKPMRFVIISVLFGAGLGLAVIDFAAAQVGGIIQPGVAEDIAPSPPPGRPRDIAPRPPAEEPPPQQRRPGVVTARPPVVLGTPQPIGPGRMDPRPPAVAPKPKPRGPRVVVPSPHIVKRRGPVVTLPNWPLQRPPRHVVVRPPRGAGRVRIEPRLFLPPVVFGGAVVIERRGRRGDHGYSRDSLMWQDSETLYREDDWTEFTLDCNARGSKLWFEVAEGRVQVDWAEVVFENGEVQVIEFPERSLGRGIYELLDFRVRRRVDYVRLVAQTTSRQARLTLWLER